MKALFTAVLLAFATCVHAADAAATVPAAPFLGVTLNEDNGFEVAQGLIVTAVVPGSTFDHVGVRAGDRVLEANKQALFTVADFTTVARALKIGDQVSLRVSRGVNELALSGKVEAMARPRDLSEQTEQLAQQIAELRGLLGERPPGDNLKQLLQVLKQVEGDLPKAAAAFNERYPDGDFDISIHIDIHSDRKAEHPRTIGDPISPEPDKSDQPAEPELKTQIVPNP